MPLRNAVWQSSSLLSTLLCQLHVISRFGLVYSYTALISVRLDQQHFFYGFVSKIWLPYRPGNRLFWSPSGWHFGALLVSGNNPLWPKGRSCGRRRCKQKGNFWLLKEEKGNKITPGMCSTKGVVSEKPVAIPVKEQRGHSFRVYSPSSPLKTDHRTSKMAKTTVCNEYKTVSEHWARLILPEYSLITPPRNSTPDGGCACGWLKRD